MLRLSKVCLRCIPIALTLVSLVVVRPVGAQVRGTIAYQDPPVVGNQFFSGSLGQDFTVNTPNPTSVYSLGIFDSGQTGINGTLSVAIFSSNGNEVTPTITFSGNAGTLIGGDLFLSLATPVVLAPGNYSLTTAGWGPGNLNGNLDCVGFATACGGAGTGGPFTPPTLNTGAAISFTGVGFVAGGGLQYIPPEPGLPTDAFNAGSFSFPEPASAILLPLGLLLLVLARRRHSQPTP